MSDLALTQKAGNAANNEADQAKLEVASAASIKPLPALSLRPLDAAWNTSWDALAGQSVANGFMQSSEWAAFKRTEGYLTPRYGIFDGERLVGGSTFFLYPHGPVAGFIACPEGPVLPWEELSAARIGLRLLIAQGRALSLEYGALGFRIEPHLPPPRPSLLRNWARAPVDLTPIHTLMLDLSQSETALRARMHPKGRYNLGLSTRQGVSVRMSSDMGDLRAFYALFTETALRNSFFAEPYGFFLNLGAALFPTGRAALFLAHWQEEPIAALLIVFYGRRATYLYGGSSTRHRAVMPNFALHWAAIQEAKTCGCLEYDFYGYDPFEQPSHQYAGISRFKRQWGAERFDSLGAHDLIFYDQLADKVIEQLTTPNLG